MPIYEYRCESCGHELDKIQKFSDAPLSLCPNCNEEALKRLISMSSFHLKGGGWYVTDYKDGGKKGAAKSSSTSSDSAGSASASKDATATPKASSSKASAPS